MKSPEEMMGDALMEGMHLKEKSPEQMAEMESYAKHLDDMNENDEEEYDQYMEEMTDDEKEKVNDLFASEPGKPSTLNPTLNPTPQTLNPTP